MKERFQLKKPFILVEFGKINTNAIKYSFNGIAFATNDGSYVVYNSDMTFTNVSDMVMDIPIYACR